MDPIAPARPSEATPPEVLRVIFQVALIAAFVTPFMSSTINIALPTIGREFDIDAVTLGWTATAYLLAAAVGLIPFGRLADIRGRKKIFLGGAIVYTASSVLCAAAGSAAVLIAGRALQGFGGAMIMSTGTALLTSAYPPRERGRVLGVNVASTYLGLSLGPVIGGALTQNFGWRSIFWLNVIPGLVLILLTAAKLRGEWADAEGESFDAAGAVLLGLTLILLMLGLSWLPRLPGAAAVVGAAVGLAAFLHRERRARAPLLDLDLFRRNAVFVFSNLAALINYSATSAVGFLLSLYLQHIKGLSPQKAGFVLIAQPLLMALFSPLAGRLSDRIEPRRLASAGMGVSVLGLVLLSFLRTGTAVAFVAVSLSVLGFGFALFSAPNTNAVMSSVEKKNLGIASAMLGTMRLTGQMLSMGLTMLLFTAVMGRVRITPDIHARFLVALRVGFLVFAALCVAGVFASLARGRLRTKSGEGLG